MLLTRNNIDVHKGASDLAAQYKWQMELRNFEGVREWIAKAGLLKPGDTYQPLAADRGV